MTDQEVVAFNERLAKLEAKQKTLEDQLTEVEKEKEELEKKKPGPGSDQPKEEGTEESPTTTFEMF